ncbi:alanyl-tRNA editing protein [Halorubrum sp. AD140]|uniref:alanyl-tRNA editing protein n=1 Tax=Halorubrum sp. AD140 TaxID=3050073 RepID=UPI002ACC8F4C|nr:alanyl-tRNA editing protein [Halorubrum sp. AD140]MDZ5812054.1 alanyl-tRNA editing protein [Halorubrum sp. AD140]
MTEELYLADDTVTTFEATVERALDDRVVLDRTHFYPTGGGQPHDTGTLRVADGEGDARWRVVDVRKKDTIYHVLAPAGDGDGEATVDDDATVDGDAPSPPEPGTAVVGEIDAARRAAHSKYHTAQHLLSALLLREFDAETTGNQLYHDHAHLDAAYDRFDDADLDRIETRLTELVADARPVTSYVMDRAEAEATLDPERTRIHLLPDSIEVLRIVEIGPASGADEAISESDADPYDRTACAGTHVGNTAEIGEVVVTGRETKGSDEERVRFALADHLDDAE